METPPILSDEEADKILARGLYFDHKPSNGEVHRIIQRDQDAAFFEALLKKNGLKPSDMIY